MIHCITLLMFLFASWKFDTNPGPRQSAATRKGSQRLGQNETKFDPRAEWNWISRIANFSRCWRLGVTKRQNESKWIKMNQNDPSGCKPCSSLDQIDHRAIILKVSFISRILAINITGTSQQRAPQSFRWCGSKIAAEGLSRLSRQVTRVESWEAKHAQSGSPCGTRLELDWNNRILQITICYNENHVQEPEL